MSEETRDSVSMWNDLGPKLRESELISKFKDSLLKLYRPVNKSIFNVHDNGIKWIFQLRVGLSPLKSHKKGHIFFFIFFILVAVISYSIVLILLIIERLYMVL